MCSLKPDADLCMRLDLPLNRKTVENQDWAIRPPGRRAVAGHGPRAAGPGRKAPWPGRGGPWAAGPPAGRWAAGLRLAKPKFSLEKGKPWYKIQRTVLFNKRKILTETGTSVYGCRYHLSTAPVLHIIPEPSMFNYSMFRPRLHGSGQIFTRTNFVPGRPFYMDPCKFCCSGVYTDPCKV